MRKAYPQLSDADIIELLELYWDMKARVGDAAIEVALEGHLLDLDR